MGSPVSPIVVNLCMEEIEELTRSRSKSPPKKWCRFVHYIFAIIKRHMLTNFYSLLNSIDPHIKLIMKQKQDDKVSSLDTYTRNSVIGSLLINVYRKPSGTDAYLDFNLHHVHGKQHKVSASQTLLFRATTLPNPSNRTST